jgi:hypothetical protein
MVDVRFADDDDMERWDDLVAQSPHGTPFHRRGALSVLAEHSGTTLHPLVGYKGQEPVGLLPIYELSKPAVTALFSPPPWLKVSYQGPLLVDGQNLKRRKADKRTHRFVEDCLETLQTELSPNYIHVRTGTRFADTRAFTWNGFDVESRYTYVVDLTPDPETLLGEFSSDARRNIRNGDDGRYTISVGGREAIGLIVEQLRARHEAQGESYSVTPAFVADLWQALPDGTVRPYVCTVDGEFAGGMVTLESKDTVYRWQGGAKPESDLPVNDLVDWRIMRDAADRGLTRYDLVGANNRRISRYKAKFAPQLETYGEMEWGTPPMRLGSAVYRYVSGPLLSEVRSRVREPLERLNPD